MLMMLCCWLAPNRLAGYRIFALRAHIGLSLIVLAAITFHALGILISNDVAIEYLKWRAPGYMHAGNLAFLIMLVLSAMAIKRVRLALHKSFDGFRHTHRLLSLVIVVLTGWHIIGSGYLTGAGHGVPTGWTEQWSMAGLSSWRGGLLGCLLLLTTVLWWRVPQRYRPGFADSAADVRRSLCLQFITMTLILAAYLLALHWAEWEALSHDA